MSGPRPPRRHVGSRVRTQLWPAGLQEVFRASLSPRSSVLRGPRRPQPARSMRAMARLDRQQSPSREAPGPACPVTSSDPSPSTSSVDDTPTGGTGQAPEPCPAASCSVGSAPSQPVLPTNPPEGQSPPLMCEQQPRLSDNRKARTTHTRATPEAPGSGDQGDCRQAPQDPCCRRPLDQNRET